MSEPTVINCGGDVVVPGETRCRSWPRSCKEVQATTATVFRRGLRAALPELRKEQQERCEKLEEARSELRDALALVHESTNDPRILAITRTALQHSPEDEGAG